MISPWFSRYVGIPYKDGGRGIEGCDCYGLVRLVYMNELRIELPMYSGYESVRDYDYINQKVIEEKTKWLPSDPEDFAVGLWTGGKQLHIGILINTSHVLHTGEKLAYACIQPWHKVYGSLNGWFRWAN